METKNQISQKNLKIIENDIKKIINSTMSNQEKSMLIFKLFSDHLEKNLNFQIALDSLSIDLKELKKAIKEL